MSMETWKPRRFVEEFQKRAGLLIDGKPGPQTQMALEFVPELPPGRLYPPAFDVAYFGPDKITAEQLRKIVPSPLDTPTPIDPADIRPGDVVEIRHRINVTEVEDDILYEGDGEEWWTGREGSTAYLIHRPDPDAEAVEAIRSASYNIHHGDSRVDPLPGLVESGTLLEKLRDQGWDVVRRAES